MKPIYLLIGEIFELERKGWVQRQIGWIATYLLQSFDKKLNRLYHDKFYEFTQEENIAKIVDMINNAVWPGNFHCPPV